MKLFKIYGIMGCGKSTLTESLCETFNATLWVEPFEENPFLPLFYAEMVKERGTSINRFALPLQLYFLTSYMRQNEDIQESEGLNIQDGGAFSGYAYTKTQHNSGMITDTEYDYFTSLYKLHRDKLDINHRTLYIDLDPSEAHRRVINRSKEDTSRSNEQDVPLKYLIFLDECYRETFEELDIPVEFINTNGLSKEETVKVFKDIIDSVQE